MSLALLPPAAEAVTFTVTKLTDDNGSCEVDDCSLREAVLAANAAPGADVIILPGGTYQLSIVGPEEDLSMTGDIDVFGDLEIRGDERTPVVIVGDGSDRVFRIGRSTVTISNVTVTGGVSNSGGGGIYISFSNVTIVNSTIRDNRVDYFDGGGVYSVIADTVLVNCTVSGNTSTRRGGGVFSNGSARVASMTLINTTVSGNTAIQGGGIYNYLHSDLVITNSTITGNTADRVSGVFNVDTWAATWTNSVIDDQCGFVYAPAPLSGGGNVESPGATCYFSDPTDRMNVPDLLLGPLANYGGPTATHALLPGSPAIDAGVAGACPATDQRGVARPQDGDGDSVAACDSGAYEALPRSSAVEIPVVGTAGHLVLGLLLAIAALVRGRISRRGGR